MKFGQEVVGLSEVAMDVLKYRYLSADETPADMFSRVASLVASVEEHPKRWGRKFYRLMASLDFLPNTPTLVNAGKPRGQLAACFVLPVPDNVPGIFEALKQAAIIHKGGGGTGFSFSRLRPEGSVVEDTGGVASGPVSFMRVFDAATGEMKQGGVRRGANMGVLRVDHPDIMKFIKCKKFEGDFPNFNISVGITNEFMDCLDKGEMFTLHYPGKSTSIGGGVHTTIDPSHIWDAIINGAWANGEPGVVFLDRVNRNNPVPGEIIEGTNPCGEQPLPPYGVCNLGSINLSNFVVDGKIDFGRLAEVIPVAVRFLDNIIDVNHYPLEDIKREALRTRRIGLGIMGLADMFIKLRLPYGSKYSVKLAGKIMSFIQEVSWEVSQSLGVEKGVPPYIAQHKTTLQRRNGALTTIAPTGSLSLIAGCSSGCEPVFAFEYEKRCIDSTVTVVHPLYKEFRDEGESHAPLPIMDYFVTAKDVPINHHIAMQSELQKYVDSGISKTINAPHHTTPEEVSEAFVNAYKTGCNSISFYREGSRKLEGHTDKKYQKQTEDIDQLSPIIKNGHAPAQLSRPNRLRGVTAVIKTGRGKLYVTVNDVDGKPFEVFLKIGKSGREDFAYSEALGRIISLALRSGVEIDKVIKHLRDISGYDTVFDYGQAVKSVPDAVSIVLDQEYGKGGVTTEKKRVDSIICPDCDRTNVVVEEGCIVCKDCGWSRC